MSDEIKLRTMVAMRRPAWFDPELDAEEDPAVLREDGLNEPPTKEQP